jgi:photosystem II stability/assembly factor-like uncharacterized protein
MSRAATRFALLVLLTAPAGLAGAGPQSAAAGQISSLERRDRHTFVAVDPFDDRILYAGTARRGVFKSTDEGQTWRSSSGGLERPDAVGEYFWEISRIEVDARHRGVLYVATPGGAFRSVNGAEAWQKLDVNLPPYSPVTSIVLDPFDDRALYIGASAGVAKSVDSGRSWVLSNSGIPAGPRSFESRFVSHLVADPHQAGRLFASVGSRVYRSNDAAQTWEEASTGIPERAGPLLGLAIDPARRDTVYLGTYQDGVFRTTDSGASWAVTERGFNSAFWTFAFDVSGLGLVYSADSGHVLRSKDGVHWASFGSPLTRGVRIDAIAVTRRDPRHLFISSPAGLFESRNGAGSWRAIPPLSSRVEIVKIHPTDSKIVLVGTDRGGVLRSTDGGDHWAILGLDTETVTSLVLSRRHVGLVVAGTLNGLFLSSDGGKRWASVNHGLCTQQFCDRSAWWMPCSVAVPALATDDASNPALYAAVSAGGLYRSTDLGASWQPTALRARQYDWPSINAIGSDPGNPSHLVAATQDRGLLESIDRGESWSPVQGSFDDSETWGAKRKTTTRSSLALAWGSQRLFVAAPNRVFSKFAAERSWTEVLESGPREFPVSGPGDEPLAERKCNRMSLAADPFSPRLMASCDDSLSLSVDGGDSWRLLPDLPPEAVNVGAGRFYDEGREIRAIAVSGELLFVANGYGLFRSRNGGTSWEVVLPYGFGPLAPLLP